MSRVLVNQKLSCLTSDRMLVGRTVVRHWVSSWDSVIIDCMHKMCPRNCTSNSDELVGQKSCNCLIVTWLRLKEAKSWSDTNSFFLSLKPFKIVIYMHLFTSVSISRFLILRKYTDIYTYKILFVSVGSAWVGMMSIRLLLMTFTTFTGSHQSSRASKFKRSALNLVVVDLFRPRTS